MIEHEHTQNHFFVVRCANFFLTKMFTLYLFDGFLDIFSKFCLFIVENGILFRLSWARYENYSVSSLSIRGNNLIACWAYAKTKSFLVEHTRKQFYCLLNIRGNNFIAHWVYTEQIFAYAHCSTSVQIFSVFTWTPKRMLNQRRNDFIACWAHKEMISLLAEPTRKWFHRLLSIWGNNFIPGWA